MPLFEYNMNYQNCSPVYYSPMCILLQVNSGGNKPTFVRAKNISNVTEQKPTPQQVKKMNVPVVPEVKPSTEGAEQVSNLSDVPPPFPQEGTWYL